MIAMHGRERTVVGSEAVHPDEDQNNFWAGKPPL